MRQARKSLAHLPSPEVGGDKENATMDSAGMSNLTAHDKRTAKKSRSKSIGPGGLDALKESTDNKREVRYGHLRPDYGTLRWCAVHTSSSQINSEAECSSLPSKSHTSAKCVKDSITGQIARAQDSRKVPQKAFSEQIS